MPALGFLCPDKHIPGRNFLPIKNAHLEDITLARGLADFWRMLPFLYNAAGLLPEKKAL